MPARRTIVDKLEPIRLGLGLKMVVCLAHITRGLAISAGVELGGQSGSALPYLLFELTTSVALLTMSFNFEIIIFTKLCLFLIEISSA